MQKLLPTRFESIKRGKGSVKEKIRDLDTEQSENRPEKGGKKNKKKASAPDPVLAEATQNPWGRNAKKGGWLICWPNSTNSQRDGKTQPSKKGTGHYN